MATELNWRYDVYLCYRTPDTKTFTDNLYNALRNKRFITFMDQGGFETGEKLPTTVPEALEESRISLVVLSENFASSAWCLNELVKILECKKMKNQLVFPIFYHVDPSEVRHQSGMFGKSFESLEHRFRYQYKDEGEVLKWRLALSEVAELKGFPLRWYNYEYEVIEEVMYMITNHLTRYDIYLSFSEEDTRYSFTGFLKDALCGEGFNTIMKENGSEKKEGQTPQSLVAAIEKSKLSIVVLSKNYGYSSSCLDELVMILDCMKKQNQLIWPIFYNVDPSDVRHQRNDYENAMIKHKNEDGINSEMIGKWKSALLEVANLKGWHMKNRYDYEVIEKIVEAAIKLYSG